MTDSQRIEFLGIEFDNVALPRLVATLADRSADAPLAYLVTPNVDHIVRLHDYRSDSADVLESYRAATWCACDSRVLAGLAKLSGIHLSVAPGSDLTAALLDRTVQPGDRIAIIGGSQATVSLLARRLTGVEIVQHEPPMGLRDDPRAMATAAEFIAAAHARFSFIAVGSPQQELIAQLASRIPHATGTALCIGAAIEFVVGQQVRAPPRDATRGS